MMQRAKVPVYGTITISNLKGRFFHHGRSGSGRKIYTILKQEIRANRTAFIKSRCPAFRFFNNQKKHNGNTIIDVYFDQTLLGKTESAVFEHLKYGSYLKLFLYLTYFFVSQFCLLMSEKDRPVESLYAYTTTRSIGRSSAIIADTVLRRLVVQKGAKDD